MPRDDAPFDQITSTLDEGHLVKLLGILSIELMSVQIVLFKPLSAENSLRRVLFSHLSTEKY
jgi:hypothetical protein